MLPCFLFFRYCSLRGRDGKKVVFCQRMGRKQKNEGTKQVSLPWNFSFLQAFVGYGLVCDKIVPRSKRKWRFIFGTCYLAMINSQHLLLLSFIMLLLLIYVLLAAVWEKLMINANRFLNWLPRPEKTLLFSNIVVFLHLFRDKFLSASNFLKA